MKDVHAAVVRLACDIANDGARAAGWACLSCAREGHGCQHERWPLDCDEWRDLKREIGALSEPLPDDADSLRRRALGAVNELLTLGLPGEWLATLQPIARSLEGLARPFARREAVILLASPGRWWFSEAGPTIRDIAALSVLGGNFPDTAVRRALPQGITASAALKYEQAAIVSMLERIEGRAVREGGGPLAEHARRHHPIVKQVAPRRTRAHRY